MCHENICCKTIFGNVHRTPQTKCVDQPICVVYGATDLFGRRSWCAALRTQFVCALSTDNYYAKFDQLVNVAILCAPVFVINRCISVQCPAYLNEMFPTNKYGPKEQQQQHELRSQQFRSTHFAVDDSIV